MRTTTACVPALTGKISAAHQPFLNFVRYLKGDREVLSAAARPLGVVTEDHELLGRGQWRVAEADLFANFTPVRELGEADGILAFARQAG